ncbi:hypothetical protein [Alicyclobacillus fastidiosus]|nr:hypothetical protein [Alicyclobacillus fastidiosus]
MITELMLANGSTSYLAVDWTFNGNVPGPYIYANLGDSNGHTSVTGRKIFVPAGQTLTLMYNNGGSSSYSAGYYVTGYTV